MIEVWTLLVLAAVVVALSTVGGGAVFGALGVIVLVAVALDLVTR